MEVAPTRSLGAYSDSSSARLGLFLERFQQQSQQLLVEEEVKVCAVH
jgi:hypothetical protein